jgi:hypothetical protein
VDDAVEMNGTYRRGDCGTTAGARGTTRVSSPGDGTAIGKLWVPVEIVRGSTSDVSRGDVSFSTVHSPYYCLQFLNN